MVAHLFQSIRGDGPKPIITRSWRRPGRLDEVAAKDSQWVIGVIIIVPTCVEVAEQQG
jgi:hypothetical protein